MVKIDHFLWPSPAVSVQVQMTGKTEGLPFWFNCVCHCPQIFNIRQDGGYRSTQATSCAPIRTHCPACLLSTVSAWGGRPAGSKGAKPVCISTWQLWI